jgi:hypothetical protein
MSKVIKLSGKFHTVGGETAPFTPTHDRLRYALADGPGSSWARDRYEVYYRLPNPTEPSWSMLASHPTFEDASEHIAKAQKERAFLGEFLDQGPARIYRIVRARGTCEVVG